MPQLTVIAAQPDLRAPAEEWARRLDLPYAEHTDVPLYLCASPGEAGAWRLELRSQGPGAPGPVYVDWVGGALGYRRLHGGGAGQTLARAVGVKPGQRPAVLDVTGGLGRDAWVLAGLGCDLVVVERSPVVAALLADGLRRAQAHADTAAIAARIRLVQGDARAWLEGLEGSAAPAVVYLDPMYPHRRKSALVKKEMRVLRQLVGDDGDAAELLALARRRATKRVVVKRPADAPCLDDSAPDLQIRSTGTRYDIYFSDGR